MNISRFRLIGCFNVAVVLLASTGWLHAQTPPANDNFANRQILPSQTQVTVSGTTDYATQEAFEVVYGGGEPYGDGINEKNTVWYDYTAPVAGVLSLGLHRDIEDEESYTLVFKGGDTPVAANIVSQGYLPYVDGLRPPPAITVTAGQEYTISLGTTPPTPTTDDNFILSLTLTPSATPTPTPTPTATVTTPQPKVLRGGTPGKFKVSLSAAPTADLTVEYVVAGSAVAGTDYKALTGTVTVPAGSSSATVKVKTLPGSGTDPTVGVKLKLKAGTGYTVGSPAQGKVKIVDVPQ